MSKPQWQQDQEHIEMRIRHALITAGIWVPFGQERSVVERIARAIFNDADDIRIAQRYATDLLTWSESMQRAFGPEISKARQTAEASS